MTGHLLVQISDVHLMPNGTLLHGRDPRDNLVTGLRRLDEVGLHPDVFVLTGDLANSGDAECYQDLAEIMDGAAEASGADGDLPAGQPRPAPGVPPAPARARTGARADQPGPLAQRPAHRLVGLLGARARNSGSSPKRPPTSWARCSRHPLPTEPSWPSITRRWPPPSA